MTNAELIDALQCTRHFALYQDCYEKNCYANSGKGLYCNIPKLMADAADALEAAEKRIAELEQERNKTVTAIFWEEQKWWENRCKELEAALMEMTAKCGRLESQLPKECEFKSYADKIPNARNRYCTQCGAYLNDEEFENHTIRYCYWCGSKVKGEQE